MKFAFACCLVLMFSIISHSQVVGTNVYLKGNYVTLAVNGAGGHEGVDITISPVPAGYVFRSAVSYYGVYANPQMNNWLGSAYDGDFLTSGTIDNGWGFEIIDTAGVSIQASNNLATGIQIPGANYAYVSNAMFTQSKGLYSASLSGYDLTFDVTQKIGVNDLYYTTSIIVKNTGSVPVPELYYYRNMDPDNNQIIGGGFTTTNTILHQPSGTSIRAQVVAQQSLPWGSAISLVGEDANFRVARGGFTNRDGSDVWNATGGLVGTVGSTLAADEAIALAYKITDLLPGESESFEFYTVLADSLLNYDFVGVQVDYTGAGKVIHEQNHDTAYACSNLTMQLQSVNVNAYDWSWSPSTYLDYDTGTVVHANILDTITYTVIGAPIGAFLADTLYITLIPAIQPNLAITNPSPLCNFYDLNGLVFTETTGSTDIEYSYHSQIPENGFDMLHEYLTDMVIPVDTLYLMATNPLTGCYDLEPLNLVWNDVLFDVDFTTTACTTGTATAELVNISASTGTYSVLWSTSETLNAISGLNAGPLSVTITSNTGCVTSATILIEQNTFTFDLTATPEGCDHQNGTITPINISDLTDSYTYLWSNGNNAAFLDSLDAGFYSLTMTNQDGCTATDTSTVDYLVTTFGLSNAVFDASCSTCSNGSIYTFYSGSPLLPITYVWSNGANTPNVFGLLPGTYTLVATDAAGCTFTDTLFINSPVGVNEIKHEIKFTCYPNPVHNVLTVNSNEVVESYMLFAIDGKCINQQSVFRKEFQLDFDQRPKGMYTLMLTINGYTLMQKIIK